MGIAVPLIACLTPACPIPPRPNGSDQGQFSELTQVPALAFYLFSPGWLIMDKKHRSKIDLVTHEVLDWRRQGDSWRTIEKKLKEEYGLKVSYRTVQAW